MHTLLQKLAESNTVPGTLLFCGPKRAGKRAAAQELAVALMGPEHSLKIEKEVHPDLLFFQPEGKVSMHTMESMRRIINEVSFPPFEAPVRFFVIEEAHRMLPTSSNALLKTLEEPTAHSYILLLTSEPASLLPTIISRCRRIDFNAPEETGSIPSLLVDLLSKPLAYDDKLDIFEQLETEIEESSEGHAKVEAIDTLFEHILTWYRDLHLLTNGADPHLLKHPEHLSVLQEAPSPPPWQHLLDLTEKSRLALRRSIKLRHVLDHFFLHTSA